MAERWTDLPIEKQLYKNVDESAVVGLQTAIENGYISETGVQRRFPGFEDFVDLPDNGRVYMHDWNEDLIASTDKGFVYRINRSGGIVNVTGTPVAGGRRTIFAKSDKELFMAAGGPIVRLRDDRTELLSPDAPESTHVGWMDNYTLAIEIDSKRLHHSAAGAPDVWNPLDQFSADGNPDNINSMLVTPFREIMLGGADSIEQFERVLAGNVPFSRRWSVGDGVLLPYCLVFADNAMWTISALTEFVRASGQVSETRSGTIGQYMEAIDDWTDAWIGGYPDKPLHVKGSKFILLQAPNATNPYGTKGITLLYDYALSQWSELYGWDTPNGQHARWPGWSHWPLWGDVYIGGEGKIYRVTPDAYNHAGGTQRWLIRAAHTVFGNAAEVKALRLQIKRGLGGSNSEPSIEIRCSRDGKPFGRTLRRGLGKAGDKILFIETGGFGIGSTFQFEFSSSDDCAIELMKAQVKTVEIGH